MTHQIDGLRKTSPVLRVSTHIYGISKEIDRKTFILRVNLGMWSLKLMVSAKWDLFWVFQHTFMGFQGDRWENIHFKSKPRHVILKLMVSAKWALFWVFQHTFMGFQGDRLETIYFESKPRYVTPQIDGLSKMSPVLSVSTHIYGFPRR